ncbi:right-handed parallel beta-helix repeat-containing protein [Listeria rustica]|uniref:Right-handed parallel beta-helix repeat-containing protein n=1 Tax=Listeria rustica TaxID=2713503 RepID=A0A7W1T642_9LIST|nr:right-handed parallel beta-helix repeat-containing protein [Listeria rustica]MBA3926127.1 right-handed parallel beta-helix repeat-containing protein [Listeria rustica]
MKKLLFILMVVVFCAVGHQGIQAETNELDMNKYVTANNKEFADQNAYNWNDVMRNLDKAKPTTIYVPKGNFYFSQTLAIPSNVTIVGAGSHDTTFIFTKVVTGITNRLSANAIRLENLKMTYADDAVDQKASSLVSFGEAYDEANYDDYQVMDGLTIENCIIDAKKKGSSALYLGRLKNATISGNTIQNSGLQNGIGLEFCKNVRIEDNDLTDLGRSGIQMYRFNGGKNEPILIENNRITNWMQRYGYEHFKTKYEAGIPVDVMNDAGIDSYGPKNENLIIKNNVLTAGRVNSYNPNNTKILADYGEEIYKEHVIFFTGIRLCGVKDVVATGNEVDLKGRDIFTLVYINSREKEKDGAPIVTKPSNIRLEQNTFRAEGNIRYPVRIFEGDTAGIAFTNNQFAVDGKLVDNGYFAFFTVSSTTEKLLLIGNKIEMATRLDYLVSVSDKEYNGEKVKLTDLGTVLNTWNGDTVKAVRGNIESLDDTYYLQDKPLYTSTNLYTGQYREPVWKVRLVKDGVVIKQAETDEATKSYTFRGVDGFVKEDGASYELLGVDKAYKEVLRIPLKVLPILDTPAYIIGTDGYQGGFGGAVTKVRLLKNNQVLKQADTVGSNYNFKEMRSLIRNDGSSYTIIGVDKNYQEVVRIPLEMRSILAVPEYTVGDQELTGKFQDNICFVRLSKDGKIVKQADIVADSYKMRGLESIVAKDGSQYEVVGLDTGYKEVVRIDLQVNALQVSLTPNPYTLGTMENRGEFDGPISRVRLLKNNVAVKQADADVFAKTYVLKGLGDVVQKDGSTYELVGVDQFFREIVRVDFRIAN